VSYAKYGPWAVIAGGSEGVGVEFARLLAGAGINLVLVARKPEPLAVAASNCRELGVEVHTVATDLVAPDAVGELTAVTEGLEVGLFIYNAGANTCSAEFLDADLADFQRVIDLNISTMMALTQHYGRLMRERRRGGILLVGSMSGYLGSVRHTVYGGVKAYGRIFAEGLWLELRDHGVDVLELVLGVTRTPAMERVGLNFDIPGMQVADPADVAREGLEQLANGPVFVAGGNAEDVARRNDPDRTKVVAGAHRMMQRLMGADLTFHTVWTALTYESCSSSEPAGRAMRTRENPDYGSE
jgi:short-subunit dehydrogenase